jgi:hypothetical protein
VAFGKGGDMMIIFREKCISKGTKNTRKKNKKRSFERLYGKLQLHTRIL